MMKRQIIETWFRRVWLEKDTSAIHEMMAPDGNVHGLGAHLMLGPEEFANFHQAMLALVDDVNISIDKMMEDDEWASVLFSFTYKILANGMIETSTGQAWVRIVDDKIVEAYNQIDFMGMFEKLNLLPKEAFSTCLGGAKAQF